MSTFDTFCASCLILGVVLLILQRTVLKDQQRAASMQLAPAGARPAASSAAGGQHADGEACVLPLTETDSITLHQAYVRTDNAS